MLRTLKKSFKTNLITTLALILSVNIFSLNVNASSNNTTPETHRGNLGEYESEYTVEYDYGGQLKYSTVATLKFSSLEDVELSGKLKVDTLATLMFDQNPYRIVYEKGLSDDIWQANSSKPSHGYPKATEMLFDNTAGQKFRSYYEDNKERLGRNYTIRFDSNDLNDGNGSTLSTVVSVVKTEVPTIESIDFKNTAKYKQFISKSNALVNITVGNTVYKTENVGFDGTLFFKHWSVYNQTLNKNQIFNSLANIPANANLTGDFGGKVVATAIWEKRTFEFGNDFGPVIRTGYVFKGWKSMLNPDLGLINSANKYYVVDPCPGNLQNDYSKSEDYSKHVDVLQAQWQAKQYRLILDDNQPEGNHTYGMKLVAFDSPIGNLPTPVISIPNSQYVFKGWFTAKVGGQPVDLTTPWVYNHGLVIYAQWEKDERIVGKDPDIDYDIGDYDYLVPESQIVRAVELDKTDFNVYVLGDHYWRWKYEVTCPGHTLNGQTYYCMAFDPEKTSMSNINFASNSYKKFIASINPWSDYSYILEQDKSYNNENVIDDDFTGINSGQSYTPDSENQSNKGEVGTKYNYNLAFHRGKDSLTLANWINYGKGLNDIPVDILDNFANSNVPALSRYTNGFYKETTNMAFRGDSTNALFSTVNGEPVCSNGGGTIQLVSGDFNKNITVAYKVYKGINVENPNKVGNNSNSRNLTNTVENKLTIGSTTELAASGERVPSGIYDYSNNTLNNLTISFYPYIRMRYDAIDANGDITLDNTLYVLGENKRKIAFSDYAEVVYDKTKGYKEDSENADGFSLKIESSQWITDAEAQNLKASYTGSGLNGTFDNHNVFPGGATLSLSTATNIRQFITVRTYQTTLTSAGKAQVERTTGTLLNIPTYTTMKDNHVRYVNSVLNGLDGLEITQWHYYNSNTVELKKVHEQWTKAEFSTPGIQVYAGANLSGYSLSDGKHKDTKCNTDAKYYFRDYINGEAYASKDNRNDLDARIAQNNDGSVRGEKYSVYRFWVDTSGNIWVEATGDVLIQKKILLTQEQDESALGANSVIKDINDKTLVITKLRDALEYNTGDDNGATWVTDGDWYNEAFDGVEVHVFESLIETGLIDSNARTQVFDPGLSTPSNGNANNFSTYALNQFRVQNYSNTYGSSNTYQIGLYKGNKTYMTEMEKVYISKPFYNTNITVQDKH